MARSSPDEPVAGAADDDVDRVPPARPPPWRRAAGLVVTLAVVVVVFAAALPRIAEYADVRAALAGVGAAPLGLLGVLTAGALLSYAGVFAVLLPGVRLPTAFGVHMASTAVAHTVPAGGAVATGVTFSLYRARAVPGERILAAMATAGLWELTARFSLPVAAAVGLAATGGGRGWWTLAVTAVVMLAALLGAAGAAARSPRAARALGTWLGRPVSWVRARAGREPVDLAAAAEDLRLEVLDAVRGHPLAVPALIVAGHLAQALLLLASLRALDVPAAHVGVGVVLAAYALARVAPAIPLTPGGVGVVDLGLVALLTATAGDQHAAGVAAAVLVFRGLTYAAPIVLGLVAWLVLRAGTWRRGPTRAATSPGR